MANENIQKLEELLRSDEQVQAKVRDAAETFAGDRNDEEALFNATIGKVGEELGLPVSYEDARAFAMQVTELDDSQLDAVAAGAGFCYVVGIHDDVETDKCFCSDENGSAACAYVGVGFVYS